MTGLSRGMDKQLRSRNSLIGKQKDRPRRGGGLTVSTRKREKNNRDIAEDREIHSGNS